MLDSGAMRVGSGLSGADQPSQPLPAVPPHPAQPAQVSRDAHVDELLERMRGGDRDAAGEFITRYGPQIRRRIRGKLNQSMRRLFDSQEILSTVSRRLDLYILQGKLDVDAIEQLWKLVFRIADHALIEKARLYRRLQSVEGSDSAIAHALLWRLRDAELSETEGAEIEIDATLRLLENTMDRQILSMWLTGMSHAAIGRELGRSTEFVRKRWQRVKDTLRSELESEAD